MGGKYPYSDHAPGCDEYKQERFAIIEVDGTLCVMESRERKAAILAAEESGDSYTISTVKLTRDQFERMPEFQGF